MFIYSSKTPIYIPMPHGNSGYMSTQSYPLSCLIISLIVGVCAFIGVFYLVKSEITDLFDVLYALLFDIWVGLLMFLFTYAGLKPMFVEQGGK